MSFEQALAILIIAAFACLALWGRSRGGRMVLSRIYGAPARPGRGAGGAVRAGRGAKEARRQPGSRAKASRQGARRSSAASPTKPRAPRTGRK